MAKRKAKAFTKCRICGCTDEWGCDEGCAWVEPDLCSACVDKSMELAGILSAEPSHSEAVLVITELPQGRLVSRCIGKGLSLEVVRFLLQAGGKMRDLPRAVPAHKRQPHRPRPSSKGGRSNP